MQQLTGMDAAFLYAETPRAHMAGGGISIYDPSTAPGGRVTFKGILDHIDKRLHEARVFRQRLVRVPFDLDHPYWIEDPDFDLEFHVRHIALPEPGDWRQLCIQVARLVSRPLDLERPLWELYVIEGLDNVEGVPPGSFALVTKVHHAAIDGMSGMEMTSAIHDDEPTGRAVSARGRVAPGDGPEHRRAAVAGRGQQRAPSDARQPGHDAAPSLSSGGCSARSASAPSPRRRPRSRAPVGAARSAPIGCSTPSRSNWPTCALSKRRCPAPPSTTWC